MKIGNLKIETIGAFIVSYIAINMFLMFAVDWRFVFSFPILIAIEIFFLLKDDTLKKKKQSNHRN